VRFWSKERRCKLMKAVGFNFRYGVLWIVLLITLMIPVATFGQALQKGAQLPSIVLPVPKSAEERAYLGLSGSDTFKIPQIKADVVIIEIFSMYCPYCQKDAPGINELYDVIQKNLDLRDKIKIIGIGSGNSAFEVETFKKTFNVPFPLFPDQDYVIHQACGEVRTPYFIGVKIQQDKSHRIFLSQQGGFPGAQPFLDQILKESGLK